MVKKRRFSKDLINLDNVEDVVNEITNRLQQSVLSSLKRFGAIIGISGGIDSSVCLALSVKAFGPDRVIGIMMPEKDSSPESETLARELAEKFGVRTVLENITPALSGFECYERRDQAVKRLFPEYDPKTFKMKIGINQNASNTSLPPLFSLTIIDAYGNHKEKYIPLNIYLQIVAASNFKQRARMAILYYHAESMHYAVIGTPNKHEAEQGFFVKYGDGGADVMPIVHLYKSQVYQLAEYLEIPRSIIKRTPTTDTYPAEQTQEEFFFQLPFDQMDLFWYAFENKYNSIDVGKVMGKTSTEVENIFKGFERKIRTTHYLRMSPMKFQ